MTDEIRKYVEFKLKQHSRLNGLTTKEEMATAIEVNMKKWVAEAIQAGC